VSELVVRVNAPGHELLSGWSKGGGAAKVKWVGSVLYTVLHACDCECCVAS
jgi:hypothetical protein